MAISNGVFHNLMEKTTVDISFSHNNRIIETQGYVMDISNETVTIELDIPDKTMTLPSGTDIYIYVLNKGILYGITESRDFPTVQATRVSRRNHARVDDILKITYSPVQQEHYRQYIKNPHIIFEKAFGEMYKLPEIENVNLETLYELLYRLNCKVDHILEILDSRNVKKISPATFENINISASGMRLTSDEYFPIGSIIAIRLILPLTMETPLNILGEVMVSDEEVDVDKKYVISVKFINLTRSDEEIITKYVFKRQRELLRG